MVFKAKHINKGNCRKKTLTCRLKEKKTMEKYFFETWFYKLEKQKKFLHRTHKARFVTLYFVKYISEKENPNIGNVTT